MNCPRRLVAGERSGVAADAGALGDGVAIGGTAGAGAAAELLSSDFGNESSGEDTGAVVVEDAASSVDGADSGVVAPESAADDGETFASADASGGFASRSTTFSSGSSRPGWRLLVSTPAIRLFTALSNSSKSRSAIGYFFATP